VINWKDNQHIDVYNGKYTFYNYPDYGFVEEGVHESDSKQVIKFTYYALTTLSTIGYGDFLPK
jgi:hypothetical protein